MPERLNKESVTAVNNRNPYNTRQGQNLSLPLPRTEHLRNSFLNKAIREWNSMTEENKNCTSRGCLKSRLKHKANQNLYYEYSVTRMSSVNLARLRCDKHNLNGCLYARQMNDTAASDCGHSLEDPTHYFLHCN